MTGDLTPPLANVSVVAVHERGLVARLAVLLNAHDVTGFSYRVVRGTARVEVTVQGGDRQVDRAAARLRRVIGVCRVDTR